MIQTSIVSRRHYHIMNIDETDYSKIVYDRKEKLEKIRKLQDTCSEEAATYEALNVSRASYYRWKKNYQLYGLEGLENESRRPKKVRGPCWSKKIEDRVYQLRKQQPLWGKQKITVLYRSTYKETVSESTVGRILSKLMKQGKIASVRFMCGKREIKKRIFNGHAQRWRYGMKATKPGELVQVDHMTINMPGIGELKHFNAVCPVSKIAVYQVYKQATSNNAADFLKHMQREFPFELISLQVDGGSEFRAAFEDSCFREKIPLFVLPPRSPKLNGTVERGNATVKYEFYAQYDGPPSLHILRKRLSKFAHFYRMKRPHQGLGLLTPQQFYVKYKERPQSHMY